MSSSTAAVQVRLMGSTPALSLTSDGVSVTVKLGAIVRKCFNTCTCQAHIRSKIHTYTMHICQHRSNVIHVQYVHLPLTITVTLSELLAPLKPSTDTEQIYSPPSILSSGENVTVLVYCIPLLV